MKPLDEVTPDELGVESLAERGGRALDNDTCSLEGGDLGIGTTLAAGNNGTLRDMSAFVPTEDIGRI